MSEARLTRRWRFTAFHRYHRRDWSEAENREAFGAQTDPHEHDWLVELDVVGPVHEVTGFVADLRVIDEALGSILEEWQAGDLNQLIPEVRDGAMQPSTESIARWLFRRLADRIPPPARLERVGVWEGEELGAFFPA